MQIYCDGGCRGNGRPGSIGAAAIIIKKKKKTWRGAKSVALRRSNPAPTNQRAELGAIILALEAARDKLASLHSSPLLELPIKTDSKYAVGCMTDWIQKWSLNDYTNSAGFEVANRDFIERADRLQTALKLGGATIKYQWIPRERNWRADELVNANMDNQ